DDHRHIANKIHNWTLLEQRGEGISSRLLPNRNTDYQGAGRKLRVLIGSANHGHPIHFLFPIGWRVFLSGKNPFIGSQHSTLRLLALPETERDLVVENALQSMTL